jgi:hypothetical protein
MVRKAQEEAKKAAKSAASVDSAAKGDQQN